MLLTINTNPHKNVRDLPPDLMRKNFHFTMSSMYLSTKQLKGEIRYETNT